MKTFQQSATSQSITNNQTGDSSMMNHEPWTMNHILQPTTSQLRHHYVITTWCYINAFLSLKNAHTKDDILTALRDLTKYYGKSGNMEGLFKKICEKATILGIYQQVMNIKHNDLWQTLLGKRWGFEGINISGQRMRGFRQKNPTIVQPVHITIKHLFNFLIAPSKDIIDQCATDLTAIDSLQWIEFFEKSFETYETLFTHNILPKLPNLPTKPDRPNPSTPTDTARIQN